MLNYTGNSDAGSCIFIATYSDGFNLKRKEITAPNRMVAYSIASVRPPLGCTLTQLRKKSTVSVPGNNKPVDFDERIDVELTRVLRSAYVNAEMACTFVLDEIKQLAGSANYARI